ncbi:MAG: DNA polymerase III subunit gamma/tau [Aquiluna sp.]|nr:DNA polymerase III subunit gamma/tau [Aquiluna sp.]MCF8545949.1 DNA polymerase III subunit gamma/tau [Aquiluna sp.]
MTTALYRRYRPESFSELIGQTQVTNPLMAALRSDRVNHAYLFSGPRGCGKTTSARILARCLNCAEGPTDTPCGKCPSCIELSRGGSGSLDVVEIDAASHNGVDDARELRERAVFAPARDRYKIFILDEAHMVTPQGFNALLKIVEEPPAHVKFIFATTEPEKVIGTIRSRTHHYPFRLVPPGELLEYLTTLLESEGYTAEGGVMPLVVRASGGSVRDALSLLDQLIAGSETNEISYPRAVSLLGFTHDQLMSEVIDAFAEIDPAKAFEAVDKVIQSGQDARRFLEDLLERIRDLMLVSSLGDGAKAILRGLGPEQFETLTIQANRFGLRQLTQTAEATSKALGDTTAASNPRLQLELLCARVLAPSIEQVSVIKKAPAAVEVPTQPAKAAEPKAPTKSAEPAATKAPVVQAVSAPEASIPETSSAPESVKSAKVVADLSTSGFKNAWEPILNSLAKQSRSAWAVAFTTKVLDYSDEVLTLLFQSQKDVDAFKNSQGASEVLRQVIFENMGVKVKYRAKVAEAPEVNPVAPIVEPTPAEEFTEPEEMEEDVTEAIPQIVAPSQPASEEKAGEFVLREILGATPLKERDK